jgi:hypothetical protein
MVHPRPHGRRGFVARRVSDQDERDARDILSATSQYTAKVRRELRYLQEFMNANLFPAGTSKTRILSLFAAQFVNQGERSATTLDGMLHDFVKFHVDPFNIPAAEQRLAWQDLRNGVKRLSKKAKRRWVRNPMTRGHFPLERPADRAEQERWAFWALIVATGNRPNNVLLAESITCDSTSVTVKWGLRKVHCSHHVRYEFGWTETPPEWIQRRWSMFRIQKWPFPKAETIASSVNNWLKRWNLPEGTTSTSPRGSLDGVLRSLVESGRMTKEIFARTMDHKYETGLDNYALKPLNT